MTEANIRLECLRPAFRWQQPTGEEIREVLRLVGEETMSPYAAWALLCDFAGLGVIWKEV